MVKILAWLNLLDFEGRLSITNLAAIVVLGKLMFIDSANVADVGALLIAFGNYAMKRKATADAVSRATDEASTITEGRITELESKVTSLSLKDM